MREAEIQSIQITPRNPARLSSHSRLCFTTAGGCFEHFGWLMNAPAFQFYPADYLADENVCLLTLEEEGIYIRLMCHCWREGSIPKDPVAAAALVMKGGSTTVQRVLNLCFSPHRSDSTRLIHKRLESERRKQRIWRMKSAQGGINSGKQRAKRMKGGSRVVEPEGNRTVEPFANSSSSFSSSSSTAVIKKEKEREVSHCMDTFATLKTAIGAAYDRPADDPWTNFEEQYLAEVARRPKATREWIELVRFKTLPESFFPQRISALLENWQGTLDRARGHDERQKLNGKHKPEPKSALEKEVERLCKNS